MTGIEAHITGTVWKVEVAVGDEVTDGDTVGDLPWRCHETESLVGPERRVLHLIPA